MVSDESIPAFFFGLLGENHWGTTTSSHVDDMEVFAKAKLKKSRGLEENTLHVVLKFVVCELLRDWQIQIRLSSYLVHSKLSETKSQTCFAP